MGNQVVREKYHKGGLQISLKQRTAIEIISNPQKVVVTISNPSLNQLTSSARRKPLVVGLWLQVW